MVRIGLQSLKEPAARRVIQNAFERTGVAIEESELGYLLDALFTSSSRTGAIGLRSEFANLIQLQIVCRRAWDQLSQRQFAVGGPYHGSIPDARASMAAFVDEAVTSVSERARLDESWVRSWLETLVLPGKRRALISLESPSAPQSGIIDELERVRLIRVELRNESRVAELTHDSMVDALLESNESWRRRQRKSRLLRLGISVVILASLVAVFAWALIRPATVVPSDFDFSTSKSYSLDFDAAADRPYALAKLSVNGPAEGTADLTVTVRDVQASADSGLDVFNGQLKVDLDNWGEGTTIFAFKTVAGTRYRLTVATELSSLQVKAEVKDRRAAQPYAGNELVVDTDGRSIVELPPGVYSIRYDGYVRINAENVVLRDSQETVVVIDRFPLLVFSSNTVYEVKISRLAPTHHTYDGQMGFHVEGDAIAEIDVGWDRLPALVIPHCNNAANFSGYGADGTLLPKVQSSQSAEWKKSDQYLLTTAGTYRMRLKPVSGEKATCEVQVQQQGRIVTRFERVSVPMKVGSVVGAIALRMPAEGLIVAPSIEPITYSLSCRGGGGIDMSITGRKFTGWLPAGQICILAIANSDPSKFESVHIDTIKLPSGNVPGPRR
jgi:hypothetical protein